MVYNNYIKCQVCGCITRIRLQVGWQEEHPIIVTCGKCGISLTGKVEIGQEEPGLKFEFENAEIVNDNSADFIVECSGEFPTIKQRKASCYYLDTPFLRSLRFMNNEEKSYEQFKNSIYQLKNTSKKWKVYKRITNLFQNNSEFLVKEIKKEFYGEYMKCRDKFEILRAVHMIEVEGMYLPLKKDILNNSRLTEEILKLDIIQIKKFIDYLNSQSGYSLHELQELIYKIYDEFIDLYQYLIPAIFLQHCYDDVVDFEEMGTTTSSFNNIKQFYLNLYETLGNLLIIPIGLNNIKYRNNINSMNKKDNEIISLSDFNKLNKAKKFHYYEENEIYSKFMNLTFDTKLRNAIGHNDIEYDSINQKIIYIPNSKDKTKKLTKYLLEFENEVVHMFQGILWISEYLYHLRKFSLIFEGENPMKNYSNIRKFSKIGRNEPCPCGSGKKYKKCCGKS